MPFVPIPNTRDGTCDAHESFIVCRGDGAERQAFPIGLG
jgi:hypothetical protein